MIVLPDLFEALRDHFTTHGYWTLAITLLLENAGIPLPGETMLLFASFLAFEHHELNLGLIILVSTLACTLGDNLGYWIGHNGGRPLLHCYERVFRVTDERIATVKSCSRDSVQRRCSSRASFSGCG